MVTRLRVGFDEVILEPCAGDGEFVAKILDTCSSSSIKVEAIDLNPTSVNSLQQKFSGEESIHIRQADTLLDPTLDLFANQGGFYTRIIGNPPYGAWQDYDRRDILKKKVQ